MQSAKVLMQIFY